MAFITRAEKAATLMAIAVPAVASSILLSGCMSSPTYGTDKTATEQLLSDVSSIASVRPKKRASIEYKPRAELVRPAPGENLASLPAPQDEVTSSTNPDWPESPEQRLARINQEVDENRDKAGFDSPVVADDDLDRARSTPSKLDTRGGSAEDASAVLKGGQSANQRENFKKKLAETRQGSETKRRYLSEPPLEYRAAAASAPQDDIGEDEYKKERAAKRAARKKGTGGWREWLPF